ncbi:MAG: TRAP transporter TatT component family protein [Elusimicrobiales bacterium]
MKKNLFLISLFIIFNSCSIKNMAIKEIADITDRGIKSKIFSEDNLVYAKDFLPSNLKLLEMIHSEKKTIKNAANLSLGLCGYGYAFWENETEIANSFIKKGLYYSADFISEKKLLLNSKAKDDTVEIFFSNLFCNLVYLEINRDNLEAQEKLSEIEEVTEKIYEINPNYFYGFIRAIKAYIMASKPSIVGGDIEKAKELFEGVVKENDFLLNKYLYMRYAVLVLDEELFERIYNEIISWENNNSPYAFFNKIAQMKAKRLKEAKDEYF